MNRKKTSTTLPKIQVCKKTFPNSDKWFPISLFWRVNDQLLLAIWLCVGPHHSTACNMSSYGFRLGVSERLQCSHTMLCLAYSLPPLQKFWKAPGASFRVLLSDARNSQITGERESERHGDISETYIESITGGVKGSNLSQNQIATLYNANTSNKYTKTLFASSPMWHLF